MKNLFLVMILMFSGSAFAQDLNDWQQKKVDKEIKEMTEVMDLSARQIKKMTKVKSAQAIDATNISSITKTGTSTSKAAWRAHGTKFNEKARNVVSDKQWKKWQAHNKAKRNKNSTSKKPVAKKATETKLSKAAMAKVDATVSEMKKVMKLTPEQEKEVRALKIAYTADSQKIYKSTEKGPDRTKKFV